nr:MAG TPA: hypothetical protein [Caudoviricetes sp.]
MFIHFNFSTTLVLGEHFKITYHTLFFTLLCSF